MSLPLCARKKSSVPFAVDQSLHCSGCWPLFRERDRNTSSFALNLWRTLGLRCRRRHRWSPTKVIPLDADEMGKGAMSCLITNLIRLPMCHYQYYFFCAEYLDLEQSTNHPSSKSSRRSHGYPRMSRFSSLSIVSRLRLAEQPDHGASSTIIRNGRRSRTNVSSISNTDGEFLCSNIDCTIYR